MNLRSPLGRVLGYGSTKEGTDHWWQQRLSAVGVAMLGIWFAVSLFTFEGFAHADVMRWLATPTNGVLMCLLLVALAIHSYLGVQVIIEDYVHSAMLKIASLVLSKFAHILAGFAAVFSILRISLGASA